MYNNTLQIHVIKAWHGNYSSTHVSANKNNRIYIERTVVAKTQ